MHAALAVEVGVGLAHGEEGDPPAALGAVGEEFVERPRLVAGRADRVGGDHRRPPHVQVGDQRLAVGGEEVVLVAPQGEVVERVVAPAPHDLLRPLPPLRRRRIGLDEGAEDEVEERQEAEDAQHQQARFEEIVEDVVVVGVRPGEPDQPLVGGLDVAPEGEVGTDVVALGEEGDRGEEEDEHQVDGHEERRLLQRAGIRVRPEVVPEPDQREQHRGREDHGDRVRSAEKMHQRSERKQHHADAPRPPLSATEPPSDPDDPEPDRHADDQPAERSSPCTKLKCPIEKRIEVAVGKSEKIATSTALQESHRRCLGRRVTAADAGRSPERYPRAGARRARETCR